MQAASSASVAHARPTRPAAASACPADALCAASDSGLAPSRARTSSTAATAPISMGSPSGVPVPCRWAACTWRSKAWLPYAGAPVTTCLCLFRLGVISQLQSE